MQYIFLVKILLLLFIISWNNAINWDFQFTQWIKKSLFVAILLAKIARLTRTLRLTEKLRFQITSSNLSPLTEGFPLSSWFCDNDFIMAWKLFLFGLKTSWPATWEKMMLQFKKRTFQSNVIELWTVKLDYNKLHRIVRYNRHIVITVKIYVIK